MQNFNITATVVPTKSDRDVLFCLQLLRKNINVYTLLALLADRTVVSITVQCSLTLSCL